MMPRVTRRSVAGSVLLLLFASLPARAEPGEDAAFLFLLGKSRMNEGAFDEGLRLIQEAVDAAPDDPYLRLELAEALFRSGRADEAAVAADVAYRLEPGAPEILRVRGRIAMARLGEGRPALDAARESFEALLDVAGDDVEAMVALGQIYLSRGFAARSLDILGEAVRLRPEASWIRSLGARAEASLREPGELMAAVQRTLDADPDDLGARLELGELLGRSGRPAEATALLEAAPEAQRGAAELRERLARHRLAAGDPEGALKLAGGVVSERPAARRPRILLAQIELALGNFDRANAALEPLRAPDDPYVDDLQIQAWRAQGRTGDVAELLESRRAEALRYGDRATWESATLDLARLRRDAGELDQAARLAREVVGTDDPERDAIARRLALVARAEAGDLDGALDEAAGSPVAAIEPTLRLSLLLAGGATERALAEADRLASSAAETALRVGAALQDHGLEGAALPYLESAARAHPGSIETSYRLATSLERAGRIEQSIAEFRSLLERAPNLAPALNYLGYVWIERGQNLDEAVRLVREAVRLTPGNGAYVDSLGWGLFRMGRLDEAVSVLERAARLEPSDAVILEHLGDARAAAGDLAGALEAYRKALDRRTDGGSDLERKLAELRGEG